MCVPSNLLHTYVTSSYLYVTSSYLYVTSSYLCAYLQTYYIPTYLHTRIHTRTHTHTHTHTHIHTHTYTHTHTHLLNLCCQQVNTFARHWALPPRLRAKLTDFIKFQHKKGWSTSTFALPRSMEIQVSETIEHTYTLWLTTILVPLAFYINPYFLLLFFTYASSNCSIDRNEKRC